MPAPTVPLSRLNPQVIRQLKQLSARLQARAAIALEDIILPVLQSGSLEGFWSVAGLEPNPNVSLSHVAAWLLALAPDIATELREPLVELSIVYAGGSPMAAYGLTAALVARIPTRRAREQLKDVEHAVEALSHGLVFHATKRSATPAQTLMLFTQLGIVRNQFGRNDEPPIYFEAPDLKALATVFEWLKPARAPLQREVQALARGKAPATRLFPHIRDEIKQFCPPQKGEGKLPNFARSLPVLLREFAKALRSSKDRSNAAAAEALDALRRQLARTPRRALSLFETAQSPWVWQLYFLFALRRAFEAADLDWITYPSR